MSRMAKGPPPLSEEEQEQIKELVAKSQSGFTDHKLWSRGDLEDSPPQDDFQDTEEDLPPKRLKTF